MRQLIENLMTAALMDCCSPKVVSSLVGSPCFDDAAQLLTGDLSAFSSKDPAARHNPELIGQGYSSFKAVLHYRLAHGIWKSGNTALSPQERDANAMLISSRGKLLSGAEIHRRCSIGERFILDHGYGTVVGETCIIGDDCYLLGGVTLGATGIAGNGAGKRHPTVGNRVQIGAFARVYGTVNIGDDVFIGPHCLITHDVPEQSVVTLKSEHQVMRAKSAPPVGRLSPSL